MVLVCPCDHANTSLVNMPHIITYSEEIEEHGYCQQRPELRTGDKYLHEVEGKKRLRIVLSVHLDKYVWENVAQWSITIMEFFEEEYIIKELPINLGTPNYAEVPIFIANYLTGVLTCDKDKVRGSLFIPDNFGIWAIRGVAPFGFYDCQYLDVVKFDAKILIAYEYAFARSGVKEIIFFEELQQIPMMLHLTAFDACERFPKFDRIFDRPFSGKYLMRGGQIFKKWEDDLRKDHFL